MGDVLVMSCDEGWKVAEEAGEPFPGLGSLGVGLGNEPEDAAVGEQSASRQAAETGVVDRVMEGHRHEPADVRVVDPEC